MRHMFSFTPDEFSPNKVSHEWIKKPVSDEQVFLEKYFGQVDFYSCVHVGYKIDLKHMKKWNYPNFTKAEKTCRVW